LEKNEKFYENYKKFKKIEFGAEEKKKRKENRLKLF
jgi:hypothetical protein